MSSNASPGAQYDATYYEHGLGPVPYQQRDVWLTRFRFVADQIARVYAPKTVFDAGCAFGYLVEALRERGIEAWGSDVSDYAISQAGEGARPYVRAGSISEPLTRHYDMITCIEVLEHVDTETGDAAIANFCAHSDAVLFSSSPSDFEEATHMNVQPPGYWAARFAAHGFYRAVEHDPAWVTAWAGMFRKQSGSADAVLQRYENALVAANTRIEAMQMAHNTLQIERNEIDRARGGLEFERDALLRERDLLRATVRGYESGRVMKLMRAVQGYLRGRAP